MTLDAENPMARFGALPPYAVTLAIRIDRLDGNNPVLIMPYQEKVEGRPGFLHGGAIAGLIEMAALMTLRGALSESDPGARFKPINVTTRYLRSGIEKETHASASFVRFGRVLASIEATAWQDDRDRPIAIAQMSYLIDR